MSNIKSSFLSKYIIYKVVTPRTLYFIRCVNSNRTTTSKTRTRVRQNTEPYWRIYKTIHNFNSNIQIASSHFQYTVWKRKQRNMQRKSMKKIKTEGFISDHGTQSHRGRKIFCHSSNDIGEHQKKNNSLFFENFSWS